MAGASGGVGSEGGTWKEVGGVETDCSAAEFLSGVAVWVRRPQVVNRRLVGAVLVEGDWEKVEEMAEREFDEAVETRNGVFVRELIPRRRGVPTKRESVTVTSCPVGVSVTFHPADDVMGIRSGRGSYRLNYNTGDPNRISLWIFSSLADQTTSDGYYSTPDGVTTPTVEWLYSTLLPKVLQWAEERRRGLVAPGNHESLVSLGKYSSLYRELREKYGPPLIENWPEATDPHKFVYEDISIAAYLLLLWEKEREELSLTEKQTFIDLGCGNGLLVYLLTSEGHTGKGIDLRRRKIWGYYGNNRANLEVCSLTPSDLTVYPEFDWLIGNHSDELTPWIPLMAARSSYRTRYFLLPCCPHDFDSKFRRPDTTKSQYSSYLDYVRLVGKTMGFKVREDTLRIPSSKRVCHVGQERWYLEEEEEEMEKKRDSFLRERCCHDNKPRQRGCVATEGVGAEKCDPPCESVTGGCGVGGVWSNGFVPRSATDQTRNCSRVERNLQLLIVQTLTSRLLQSENWITIIPSLITHTPHTHHSPHTPHTAISTNNRTAQSFDASCEAPKLAEINGDVILGANDVGGNDVTRDELSETEGKDEAMSSCLGSRGNICRWNLGGQLSLSEAARLFDTDVLRQLKHECGGLQTLLRNHHQVFRVSGGFVQLRNWAVAREEHGPRRPAKRRSANDARRLLKTKPCWFYHHHPNGCPRSLTGDPCPYAHGRGDLRKRPDFNSATETVVPFSTLFTHDK